MKAIGERDIEARHSLADKALCNALYNVGFKQLVAAFDALEKWYG